MLPRLAAWLDGWARTWPATINPHLFVNRRTAPRLTKAGRPFPWRGLSFTIQALREDRILNKVRATGGDVRRICELFDLGATTFDPTNPIQPGTPTSVDGAEPHVTPQACLSL